MKNQKLILLLFLLIGTQNSLFAEGQDALGLFLDAFDFVLVFSIWAIALFVITRLVREFKPHLITRKINKYIWYGTAPIALFIWTMIKHDPRPFEGPIDSLFPPKFDRSVLIEFADSSVEYTWSLDSTIQGSYIRLNNERIFVRPLTTEEINHKGLNDSLTIAIVRNWKEIPNDH